MKNKDVKWTLYKGRHILEVVFNVKPWCKDVLVKKAPVPLKVIFLLFSSSSLKKSSDSSLARNEATQCSATKECKTIRSHSMWSLNLRKKERKNKMKRKNLDSHFHVSIYITGRSVSLKANNQYGKFQQTRYDFYSVLGEWHSCVISL